MAGISLTGPDIRQHIGNVLFTLLILVIMLDPTNTVLHLKDVFFVLLVGYNMVCFRPDWHYLPHIAAVFGTVTLGYLVAEVQQNAVDYGELLALYKSFSPLVLLLWIRYYDVIRMSIFPAFLTCLLLGGLYIFVVSSPVNEVLLWNYVQKHDDMIMMSTRHILGVKLYGMYYKSLVCLMFAMFICYYRLFNCRKSFWQYILPFIVFTFAFLVSGTRSTMLLPFFMIGLVSYEVMQRHHKMRYLFYPVLVLFLFVFLTFILLLAMEQTESSNVIKYGHLRSYMVLFEEHPWYLLIGQGAATSFYTEGFGYFCFKTEWTYIELVRYYGLFSAFIMAVVLYPLKPMLICAKENIYTFGIMCTYIAYLLIAGTNPLLVSSTGMLVILSAYSYVELLVKDNNLK